MPERTRERVMSYDEYVAMKRARPRLATYRDFEQAEMAKKAKRRMLVNKALGIGKKAVGVLERIGYNASLMHPEIGEGMPRRGRIIPRRVYVRRGAVGRHIGNAYRRV